MDWQGERVGLERACWLWTSAGLAIIRKPPISLSIRLKWRQILVLISLLTLNTKNCAETIHLFDQPSTFLLLAADSNGPNP